jgi:hypothetical protein
MALRDRPGAARYLTEKTGLRFTQEGLAALATRSAGPVFSLLAGRAVYETQDLDEWVARQLANKSPAAKRGSRIAA